MALRAVFRLLESQSVRALLKFWYEFLDLLFNERREIQAHIDKLDAGGGGYVDLRGREFMLDRLIIPESVQVIAATPAPDTREARQSVRSTLGRLRGLLSRRADG